MLAWFPITLEERLLQTFFLARDVPAPIGFARFVLNVILRKPAGALPTEPLIPLASRTEFLVNYADVKVDSPMRRARLLQEFERLGRAEWVISGSDADSLALANQLAVNLLREAERRRRPASPRAFVSAAGNLAQESAMLATARRRHDPSLAAADAPAAAAPPRRR